jgi:hypothetical protein
MIMLMLLLSVAQPPHPLAAAITGDWRGTLEYRDYQSDRRVSLPTTLTVTADGNVLTLAYVYDDGPGKTVRSIDRVTIDAAAETYRIQNGDGTYDATFAIEGLRAFGSRSPTVVLTGRGEENGAAVELRITLTVGGAAFSMLRESRLAGEEWRFRNNYRFTR